MRRFPALSYSGSESDSFALFSARISFAGSAQEEVVLKECAEILAEVFVGVQCCLGQPSSLRWRRRSPRTITLQHSITSEINSVTNIFSFNSHQLQRAALSS